MRRFEILFKKIVSITASGIKRAGNLFQDFLLGGAAGGRLVFSLESLYQVNVMIRKTTEIYKIDTV